MLGEGGGFGWGLPQSEAIFTGFRLLCVDRVCVLIANRGLEFLQLAVRSGEVSGLGLGVAQGETFLAAAGGGVGRIGGKGGRRLGVAGELVVGELRVDGSFHRRGRVLTSVCRGVIK